MISAGTMMMRVKTRMPSVKMAFALAEKDTAKMEMCAVSRRHKGCIFLCCWPDCPS